MNDKQKNDLYYLCSLIEFIGRKTKNRRGDIVNLIGKEGLTHLFEVADVNHSLSFEQVSDEVIEDYDIKDSDFDTVNICKYTVPGFLAIGKVYQRLILDIMGDGNNVIDTLISVFTSFISDEISDFNADTYYCNSSYLYYSYLEGELLP